jgi:outer membrane protein TolC
MPKDTLIATLDVYDFDELNARMASNNTNLRNQYINRELLKNELKSNKVNLWPTLNMSAGGSYSFNWSTLKNPEFSNPDMVYEESTAYTNPTNYYVNFTFNWLLFNGGKVKRAIKNSMITQKIGDLQIDEIKLSLNKDLLIAYDQYNTRKQLLLIAEENIKTAELNLKLADEKYKTGTISSIDYRIIQIDYQNTALSHLMAKYELILAKTELMRLTGVILSDYN